MFCIIFNEKMIPLAVEKLLDFDNTLRKIY